MGTSIHYHCQECNLDDTLMTGVGMLGTFLEPVACLACHKIYTLTRPAYDDFEPLDFDDEEDEEEGAVGESIKENQCPQCAGPLETLPTEAQSKPFRCPLCGGAAHALFGHVIWD